MAPVAGRCNPMPTEEPPDDAQGPPLGGTPEPQVLPVPQGDLLL